MPKPANNATTESALHYKTIDEIGALLREATITPVELTAAILTRIDGLDGQLKSYTTIMAEQALAAAAQAEAEIAAGNIRGPLHGVPIAVKDLCFTKEVRTMAGSGALATFVPSFDATVVERLAAAGAILIGKLNMTEGAMGGYHPDFDIPLNPWNHEVWPGGSSSGSGVATAAGMAYATIGSDTGGSIRFPAAACGIVGLKPTWGRVSRHGVFDLAASLDHVGPLTRTVADAVLVYEAIAGADPHDPTALHTAVEPVSNRLNESIDGVRVGFPRQFMEQYAQSVVVDATIKAIERLEQLGATVVEVALPNLETFPTMWMTICTAEAVAAHRATYPEQRDAYGPWFRDWLDHGAVVSGSDYAQAHHERTALIGNLNALFQQIDILAMPTMPDAPFAVTPAGLKGPMTGTPKRVRFTGPFNCYGAPALSLPSGFTEEGLPLALQLVGRHLEESLLCRVGHAYQQATSWQTHHPPIS